MLCLLYCLYICLVNSAFFFVICYAFKMMGYGLACSGLGGVGQGIGQIFSSLVEAMAQNPGLS